MSDDLEQQETGGVNLARRRAMWRALGVAPVILTLSSTPAWASHYGYCDLPEGPPQDPPPICGEGDPEGDPP